MEMILATKSSTPIIGQLATVMGWIMDGIYRLLNIFGIQNIGLCIVIFSILIYALMTPLQIKQQKFSKLSAIMQPELQKIQKKYLIKEAWKAGKEVAVPKVVGKDMVFYKLTDFARLEPGYFGIPEPVSGEIVNWSKALMIMPGVAFDRANHRVGYGGGFYDRYLEKHPQLERVAIAFSFQMLPEVPTEPTDICPQIIVTEEEICYLTD